MPNDELLARLAKLIRLMPEFEDDLDSTACPTGYVACRFCEAGGHRDGRKKMPIGHAANCPLAAALADTLPWTTKG